MIKNGKSEIFFALILTLICLTVFFFSCTTNEDNVDPTKGNGDVSVLSWIKQDYFNQLIKPLDTDALLENLEIEKEYGEFDGYIVIKFNSLKIYPSVVIPIEIGGVLIDWEVANRIIAWKDGQLFTLISAQENNILSQESLREIALEEALDLNEEEEDVSIETKAKQTYLDSLPWEALLEITVDDISFQPFLGIYDDVLVAGYHTKPGVIIFPDVQDGIEIDGMYIEWEEREQIRVWKDGILYRLPEAAKQGILSKENLAVIRELLIKEFSWRWEGDVSIETKAKRTYFDRFNFSREELLEFEITVDDISFKPFLGIYDDVLVAGFYIRQNFFTFVDVVDSIEIDGVYIEWWVGKQILVWKDGILYRLPVAAEQGILSKENLTVIKELLIEERGY